MGSLSNEEKYDLITRNLQEVLHGDLIKARLQEGKAVRCYWGTAPTGRPHLGYFVPLAKIADFLQAGVEVKILLADVHAYLDNLKAPFELVAHRVTFYSKVLTSVFRSIGVPLERLNFVTGSSYQYSPDYNRDKYRLCSITSEHDARKAGAEVVKQTESPPLSGLLYPLLQALDEQYLDVDMQFGGVDQRKIFVFAEENLPKLGYRKRAHLMNAMVPGLAGAKMSSSDPNSKIDFLDSAADVKKKINKAVAVEGQVEGNGLLAFVKAVIIPISTLKKSQTGRTDFAGETAPDGTLLTIDRREDFGGPLHYSSYADLEEDYASKKLHPGDLKSGVTAAINRLLDPIRKEFEESQEFKEAERLAYPPPAPVEVKKKKEKKYTPKPPDMEARSDKKGGKVVEEKEDGRGAQGQGAVDGLAEQVKKVVGLSNGDGEVRN